MYGKGISKASEIVDLGVKFEILRKSGAWFSYGDLRIGQGRDNTKTYFEDNPEIMKEVEDLIREKLRGEEIGAKKNSKADEKKEKKAAPAKKVSKADIDILVDDE